VEERAPRPGVRAAAMTMCQDRDKSDDRAQGTHERAKGLTNEKDASLGWVVAAASSRWGKEREACGRSLWGEGLSMLA